MSDPGAVGHDDFMDSLLGDFLDESAQLLDRLNENLLQLDEWVRELGGGQSRRCDEELLNEMFRAAHSLKGLSAMLGLTEINTLTHKVENVFDAARKEQLPLDGEVVELVFQAVDRLSALIDALKGPPGEPVEYESVIDAIGSLLRSAGAERKQATQSDAENVLGSSPAADAPGSSLAAVAPGTSAGAEAQRTSAGAEVPRTSLGADAPKSSPGADALDSSAAAGVSGLATETAFATPDQAGPEGSLPVPAAHFQPAEAGPCADPDKQPLAPGATPRAEPASGRSSSSPCELATCQPATQQGVATALFVTQPEVDHFQGLEDDLQTQSKYLEIFIDEAELSLDELTDTMLALESGGDPEAVEKLMVTAHRLKGSAASVGLKRPAKLAHLMEDLLQGLIDTRGSLTPEVTDALLMCADGLRKYVEGLRNGSPSSEQFNQLAHELIQASNFTPPSAAAKMADEATAGRGSAPTPRKLAPAPSREAPLAVGEELKNLVLAAAGDAAGAFAGRVRFQPQLPLAGLKARLIHEKLNRLGKLCYFRPPIETVEELETLEGLEFGLLTEQPREAVLRQLRIAGIQAWAVEPLAGPAQEAATAGVAGANAAELAPGAAAAEPGPPAAARQPRSPADEPGRTDAQPDQKGRAPDSTARPNETLRVDVERLDSLMNLAGQLVITKARFARLSEQLKGFLGTRQFDQVLAPLSGTLQRMTGRNLHVDEGHLRGELERMHVQARCAQRELEAARNELQQLAQARAAVNHMLEAVHQLERITDGIQQGVMDTRMVPIGPLFARFRRVVRDITRSNGKLINLEIRGEKTELDKRMIDELGDPLIHLVRNAADHGIEPPEVREAAGKPRRGTIVLDAFHRGNSIVVQVRDDGQGLDPERIKRKALEKGLASEAELARMSRSQVYELIWEPGLSTAEKVTEVSGRGMGMDIVKSKIEALNGTVELDSTPGQGTTFSIKLPLTLAILPSLLVEIAGGIYSLPLESVVEIVQLSLRDIATVHGRRTARIRGRIVSLVHLGEIFPGFGDDRFSLSATDQQGVVVVVIGEKGRQISLAVDRVLGEEDMVIKSIAENYRNVAGVAGASILGDGRVALILDTPALIDMASRASAGPSLAAKG